MRDLIFEARARLAAQGEKGQGMVEYGLIIILVSLVVIVALMVFGPTVANVYNNAGSSLVG